MGGLVDIKILFLAMLLLATNFENHCSYAQTDQTLKSEASGKDVAEASYNKIRKVFGADHRFLIRVAWVESQFGEHTQTFRKDYFGGIWQVDKAGFLETQNVGSHPNLKSKFELIKTEFNIDWPTVKWEDCTKPLYSALAARLLLLNKPAPIPTSIEDQAEYWKTYYNSPEGKRTKEKFINDVKNLESCEASKSKCRLDFVIVLDGSVSISPNDFSRAREFVADLVMCILPSASTRIGFLVYSSGINTIFPLENNLNNTDLKSEILGVVQPRGGTDTAAAIDVAVNMFIPGGSGNTTDSKKIPVPVPKIMIVLTDGLSDNPSSTAKSALRAKDAGIIAYAVGIGSGINSQELNVIAGSIEEQIMRMSSYNHLTDLTYEIRAKTCGKPLKPIRNTTIADSLHQNEISFYAFHITEAGFTFSLEISTGDVQAYYSYTAENPTSALNDGILTKGKNYIPPPPPAIRKPIFQVTEMGQHNRQRRQSQKAVSPLDEGVGAPTKAGDQGPPPKNANDTEVVLVDVGEVFIAFEGLEPMNNFTIFTEIGDSSSSSTSGFRSVSVHFSTLLIISIFGMFWKYS